MSHSSFGFRALLFPLALATLSFGCSAADDSVDLIGEGDGDDEGYTGYGETGGADTGNGDEDGGDEPEIPNDDGAEDTETETETGAEPVCNDLDDVVLYLSPDDSNSMSSPVQVRERVLTDGSTNLGPVALRPWEFMNYYGFDYAAPEDGDLALSAELRGIEAAEPDTLAFELQLAVTSELMTDEERPPMNLTLVLDTSGSMSGEPIELLRESCRAIAASLRAGDKVSMVQWDTGNSWDLAGYVVTGPNDPMLLAKINALEAGGGTDLNGGLLSGYELAQQTWDLEALNRLVLISDGGANAGVTDVEIIAENAVYGGSDGIYMVGAGVDLAGTYNDDLMDTVTDAGKGASVFITDTDEAWKVFNTNFVNTMALAARDVQVELTLPPGFEIIKFSGEEFASDPKEVEPQHLAPNDSMVFYQQIQTCAPELVSDDAQITVTARWEDVGTFEPREVARTYTFAELFAGDTSLMTKGAAILAYTDALIAHKAGEPTAAQAAMDAAYAALDAADVELPGDADLVEIRAVLDAL